MLAAPFARPTFVFAPDRCTACEACRIACGIENASGRDTAWRTLLTFNPSRHPALPTRHLSLACNHCDTPACALGCPANAYRREPATGAVILDPELCIGCRYCSWLCPYDAPRFDPEAGVMTKCTFCAPRLAGGGQPACTQACPTAALSIGVRSGEETEPVLPGLLSTTGLGPALRVVAPRRASPPPTPWLDSTLDEPPAPSPPARKITLRSEWTLALFTVAMPALVAWLGAGLVVPDRAPALVSFLALAALAVGASALHLGRPLRAWRAALNLRSSWLSREAVLAALFVGLGAAWLVMPVASAVGWAALAAGLGLAVSIDAVYRAIPREDAPAWHSADAALSTAFLLGIGTGATPLALAAAASKLLLLARRWRRGGLGVPAPLAWLRLALLLGAAVGAFAWAEALALAVAGEVIDRCAFYAELGPGTPAGGLAAGGRFERAKR